MASQNSRDSPRHSCSRGTARPCRRRTGVLRSVVIAFGAVVSGPVSAQDLTLVTRVIESETRQPVAGATIEHRAADSTVLARAVTDPRGIAELSVSGEAPYRLHIQRLGYLETGHVVEEVGNPDDGRWLIQVEVERSPLEIEGITAEAEAWEGYFGPWVFRADGMYHERALDFCRYLIVDERLITDSRQMLRTMRRYFAIRPASPETGQETVGTRGLRRIGTYIQNNYLPEQYREPAWPCGAKVLWTAENYSHRNPPW
jgi:hypothetical protein